MIPVTTASAMAKVERGAAMLDKEFPGWEESIDPGRIMIASTSMCILGQLARRNEKINTLLFERLTKKHPGYYSDADKMYMDYSQLCDYLQEKTGFVDVAGHGFCGSGWDTSTDLDVAWRQLLKQRAKAKAKAKAEAEPKRTDFVLAS